MASLGIVKPLRNKCIVCEGAVEKSNMGTMCNACKDKLSGSHRTEIIEQPKISQPTVQSANQNIPSTGFFGLPTNAGIVLLGFGMVVFLGIAGFFGSRMVQKK